MIENKLQFYQTRAGYDVQKNAGNIPNDALVFVKDTHEIITHGEEGFGGNQSQIDARITNAINNLDSAKSQNAGADGLSLSITETDGKIASISGSIAANTYDSYGSASAAQSAAISAAATDATTKVNAAKAELKGSATSACDTLGEAESKINANTIAISNEVTARTNAVNAEASRAQAAEQLLQEQYNALTQSDIIVGTLPASGTKNLIYRVPGTNSYSDYMWNGTQFVKMAEYGNAIDDKPIPGSNNLVKSGAVAEIQTEIDGVTKREVTFTSSFTSYYVPIGNATYIAIEAKNNNTHDAYLRVYFVDDNDQLISSAGDWLIAQGATKQYATYTSQMPGATKIKFSQVYGNSFDIEVDSDDAIKLNISELQKKTLYEVVDANGKGDYSTLEEAIYDNISDRNNPSKHRTIIVMPGTYTMNTYYGSTAHYWDVISNRNLSIIGVDRDRCILQNTKGKYIAGSNRIDDACLKLAGNVLIKNFTLSASHENFDGASGTRPGAYCIHLDSGGDDCNLEIDNCIMINKQDACIGIGTVDNYTIQIRNCKLITQVDNPTEHGSWSGAIICHNTNYTNPATLRLENNVMKSNTPNTLCVIKSDSYLSGIKLEAYRNIIGGNVNLDSEIVTLDELSYGNNKSLLNYQN